MSVMVDAFKQPAPQVHGRCLAVPGADAEAHTHYQVYQASSTHGDLADVHSHESPETEDEWDCGVTEDVVGDVLAAESKPASQAGESHGDWSQIANDLEIPASELTIEEPVGDGCTADVFKAFWRGHVVAVKEMRETSTAGHKEKVAFHRELSILAKVNHQNLVRLYAVSFAVRPWRIVTEFCAGGTLFQLLHEYEGDFEPSMTQNLKMCTDIARGMDYLHRFPPPIVHRDLKSLNLLLSEPVVSRRDPVTIKVADFGLARVTPTANGGVATKMTPGAGTLNWMAPEVAKGEYYDEKADVYSYAMVVYEIICLEIPFEDEENPARIVQLVNQGVRPDLQGIPPDCPRFLAQLMVSCWAHQPRQRPSFEYVVRMLETAATAPEPRGPRAPAA